MITLIAIIFDHPCTFFFSNPSFFFLVSLTLSRRGGLEINFMGQLRTLDLSWTRSCEQADP